MGAAADQTIDPIAQFMAANLFYCHHLAARITGRQCEVNRARDLYLCGKCEVTRPAAEVIKARRPKRHKGDNPDSPWRNQLYDRIALAEHEAQPTAPSTESTESTASTKVRSGQVRSGQVRSGQVRSGQTGGAAQSGHPFNPADNGREAPEQASH